MEVISELQDCDVWSVSPSDVCLECYRDNNSAVWLSYLTCIRPNEHTDSNTITVVVSDQQLVPVRSADHLSRLNVSRIEMCRHDPSHCPRGERCRFAHSEEELNYWRWERAKDILDNEFPLVIRPHLARELRIHVSNIHVLLEIDSLTFIRSFLNFIL